MDQCLDAAIDVGDSVGQTLRIEDADGPSGVNGERDAGGEEGGETGGRGGLVDAVGRISGDYLVDEGEQRGGAGGGVEKTTEATQTLDDVDGAARGNTGT